MNLQLFPSTGDKSLHMNLTVRGAKVEVEEGVINIFESQKLIFGKGVHGIPYHAFPISSSDPRRVALINAAQSRSSDLNSLLTLARRLQLFEVEGNTRIMAWSEEPCEAVLESISKQTSAALALNLAVLRCGAAPLQVKTNFGKKSKMAVSKAVLPAPLSPGNGVLAKFHFQSLGAPSQAPNGGWVQVTGAGPERAMTRDLLFHGFHGINYNLLDEDDARRFVKDVVRAATPASESIANFLSSQAV